VLPPPLLLDASGSPWDGGAVGDNFSNTANF